MIRKSKPEDKDSVFLKDLALVSEQRQTPLTPEYVYSLGRSVYMIMDPEVLTMLTEDGQLKNLIPAFSHLNRTTNIDKREAELLSLNYEFLILIHKLNMNEDQYENLGWAKLESLKMFARNMISDAFHGWKGRLVTEQIKIIKTELEKKKRGLLSF